MAEYSWRDNWEECSSAGDKILTVFKMETGELVSVSARKSVCIHDANGAALPNCLFSGFWNLKPKRTLRPWTAAEVCQRFGAIAQENDNGRTIQIRGVRRGVNGDLELIVWIKCHQFGWDHPRDVVWTVNELAERFTIDGSPCGVFEEVKG